MPSLLSKKIAENGEEKVKVTQWYIIETEYIVPRGEVGIFLGGGELRRI